MVQAGQGRMVGGWTLAGLGEKQSPGGGAPGQLCTPAMEDPGWVLRPVLFPRPPGSAGGLPLPEIPRCCVGQLRGPCPCWGGGFQEVGCFLVLLMPLGGTSLFPPPFQDVLAKVVRYEGFFSLWKGFTPYYARLGPHTVLTFIFLEQLNKFYGKFFLGT